MNKIIVVCGPTATGKSALAVELAKLAHEEYGAKAEVISADSRQVYRGLNIGSAKITTDEMQGIPHHMIDVADPMDYFSVVDFQTQAKAIINDIHSQGKLPILCGGTGLYIDAVIYDTQFPEVTAQPELRAELEKLSAPELYEKLQELDPERALSIDEHNSVRLVRAIEIATVLGSVPKLVVNPLLFKGGVAEGRGGIETHQTQNTETPPAPPLVEGVATNTIWIGLELPKNILRERIEQRIKHRISAQGGQATLFDEIKGLLDQGVTSEKLYSFGLEYRYGLEYIQEKLTECEFIEILTNKTWQFAKRQMMWFKRNPDIKWFDPMLDKQKIMELVQDFLN